MVHSIVNQVFKVGIGPSSSHTVGPMVAAHDFLEKQESILSQVRRVEVNLYGSLALTGRGHMTDKAILLGLSGESPDTVAIDQIDEIISSIQEKKTIALLGKYTIPFSVEADLIFHFHLALEEHANGMVFSLYDQAGQLLSEDTYFSIGGGIVLNKQQMLQDQENSGSPDENPFSFRKAKKLLRLCREHNKTVSEVMWAFEADQNRADFTCQSALEVWRCMQRCVENGLNAVNPLLPGGLNIERRAPAMFRQLNENKNDLDPTEVFDWVSLYAIAVNEENAAGCRVVTAPTNGSAGVIPAVMHYLKRYNQDTFDEKAALNFLMTATAIGLLYQKNASISAAEMGCQGEIGVSCSMAAAALCEFLGGSPQQVVNAAEIGMEHHLGMTCDPIDGLVQVPCIERNTMGAIKAINSARLSLRRETQHVSLDQVIKVMFETGKDMATKYKETAQGGLAVHVKGKSRSAKRYRISKNQVAC